MNSRVSHSALPGRLQSLVLACAASLILLLSPLYGTCANAQSSAKDPASARQPHANGAAWWQDAVFYEIYPRSYQDSNGDGIGDLNGITQRLGYIQNLGIDAIWITPMFPSPQIDFGYDISNYEAVDPQYGTLADMDRLIAEARKRHIRVLLDMVLNHTSDKHQWFIDASSSRTNPKHDWYVWNDGIAATAPGVTLYQLRFEHEGHVPPNNWISGFGGSAWEWVPAVHQFYYHEFYKQQPDLNWRNPAVEKACFNAMRFWLDRGVAGFRLDAIPALFEDPQLRNNPETGGINAQGDPKVSDLYTDNLPEVHDVMRRMRAMTAAYSGDRVLIGETYLPNTAELDKWYGGEAKDELNLPMDMLIGFHQDHDKLDATVFRQRIEEAETQLHGSQPLFVFDNHDNTRAIDRYSPAGATPTQRIAITELLASVLLTSRASALMYYGEELGMSTTVPTRKEDVRDPIGITGWPAEKGRDGERTPMQWTPGAQAGFSSNPNTWLPIPPIYKTVNVQTETKDPASQLDWYKHLIALRRDNVAVRDGAMTMLDRQDPDVLAYVRTLPGHPAVIVALNFTAEPKTVALDLTGTAASGSTVKTLFTSDPAASTNTNLQQVTLPPYASWIASVQ